MATSADKPAAQPDKVAPETARSASLLKADIALRLSLFSATLVALVVTVTSKQTKLFNFPFSPFPLKLDAKFNYSPALIYFVVANSVACLYSILTVGLSSFSVSRSSQSTKLLLLLSSMDVVVAGIMASATGAVSSVAYIGLKGNSHTGWTKVCNDFDKFCQHVGSAVSISLVASIILVFLVILSSYSLYLRSH
ncbi:CASP-like protein 1D1 [Canna indica]|uniref:CASP-like protein n=1 Tax=Canna indica TaxID=4628 RepID=A0AAQ3KXI3_9LILI|nr:CASP-like protein 1D1 [Canna indica]